MRVNNILFFLFLLNSLSSQNYTYRNYTVDDGLPSSEVYNIIQDSAGYIWFATDNGVSRFDGYDFVNYGLEDGLPSMVVDELYIDHSGKLWAISLYGMLAWYENGCFVPYPFNDTIRKYFSTSILHLKSSFFIDKENRIYLGTNKEGLLIIENDGNLNKVFSGYNIIELDYNYDIPLVYTTFDTSYTEFLDSIKLFKDEQVYDLFIKNKFNRIRNQIYTRQLGDEILFTNDVYLYVLDQKEEKYAKNLGAAIIWLDKDSMECIWLGLFQGGLYKYTSGNLEKEPQVFLKDHSVTSTFRDNRGGLWISTLGKGVFYLKNDQIELINVNNVTALTHDGNRDLWFISDHIKLNHYKNNETRQFEFNKDILNTVFYDEVDNKIIIGCQPDAIFYDYNKFERFSDFFSQKYLRTRWSGTKRVYRKNNDTLIFVTFGGFGLYARDKLVWNSIDHDEFPIRIQDLFYDHDGNYWLGGRDGLVRMNENKEVEYLYKSNPMLANKVVDFLQYRDFLLMGTKGAGLLIYDMKTDSIWQLTTRDGLSDNSVTCIFQDRNCFWIGTKNGLNRMRNFNHPDEIENIESYYDYHGLSSNEIQCITCLNDTLYVATKRGINIFKSDLLKLNRDPVPLFLEEVKIKDKDTSILDNYVLNYDQNSVSFVFKKISFVLEPKDKLYRYRLLKGGETGKWEYTNDRSVRFSFLPPGSYIFELNTCNEDGFWNTKPIRKSFTIKPPYWKTAWFIILMIILGLVLLFILFFIFYRYKIREMKIKEEEAKKRIKLKNELLKYQHKALSQQMNPHFIFNTLNSIQYFIYNNEREVSNTYLSMFSSLMRRTLENSDKEIITLHEEIECTELYLQLEVVRFDNRFSYNIKIAEDISAKYIYIPTFLIQPFVENAIWHGIANKDGEGAVDINFSLREDRILCEITDDGVGRKRAKEIKKNKKNLNQAYGTKITTEKLNIIGQIYERKVDIDIIDLYDADGSATGTKVVLMIPIIKK